MDGQRFDTLAKALASGLTRRRLLGTLGGALAAVGLGHTAQASCPRERPISCQGTCVDLRTDPNNCGRCGRVCASGLCYAGRCLDACPSGFGPHQGTCLRSCPHTLACAPGFTQDPSTCLCTPTIGCENPGVCSINPFVPLPSCGLAGCACAFTPEGGSVCAQNAPCGTLQDCVSTADCPDGRTCGIGCCSSPKCVATCDAASISSAALQTSDGPTFSGH